MYQGAYAPSAMRAFPSLVRGWVAAHAQPRSIVFGSVCARDFVISRDVRR